MKPVKFLLLFLFCCPGLYSKASADSSFRVDFYADSEKTFASKITSPYLETRFSKREEKNNFGLAFSTQKILSDLSFTLKTGNLSGGGSLSRLNNPLLSVSSSPFTSGISEPSLCTASLPGYTSFSKTPSAFFLVKFPSIFKKTITAELSCFAAPEASSPVTSILISALLFKRNLKINFSSTGGGFPYEENSSSSWFSNEAYYPQGKHFCTINELSIKAGRKNTFYTGITMACYETPFGSLPVNLRLDLKFSSTHTDIYATGFYNPDDGIFTSSQKSIPSCVQLKGGFLLKSLMGKTTGSLVFVKTGINVFSTIYIMQLEHPLKVNAGIQLSSGRTSFSLSASINFTLIATEKNLTPEQADFSGFSIQLKDCWHFKYADIEGVFSAAYTPQKDESIASKYKITLNLSSNTAQKFSGSTSLNFNSKGGSNFQKKISASLNTRLNYKFVYFTGKLSFSTDF